jgi:signal transduction histidine kinase/ActR/RegA family two-component response regulator
MTDLSIRWKLVLIAVMTCVIAELLAGAAITYYSSEHYERQKSRDVAVQTEVLAASLAAPLAFGDASAAREYLDALKADREVSAAGAYDSKHHLIASYVRTGSKEVLPSAAPAIGQTMASEKLTVSSPVMQAGNDLGRVYLAVDIEPLETRLIRFGGLMLLAAFGSLLIAVPLSMRLNATISRPIREIADAASRVIDGDLNAQLPAARSRDEIGVLVGMFGRMMESLRDVLQQERLRALGQMSSGVAHDINNALSPMAVMTQSLLEQQRDLSPEIRHYLETAKRVVDDVSATVGRMRDFGRKRDTEIVLAPVDLNTLVRQVIDLTRARWNDIQQTLGSVIDIKTELEPDLPPIMGVEGEIREALTNLIFNAVDAMPDGGTITLRSQSQLACGIQYVEVSVIDTGIGMNEETKRRCFEPFFTTKGERGTGLGMAMIYGMVQRHSAEIAIDSTVGEGTRVALRFLARAAVQQPADDPQIEQMEIAPLRILLVDDDPFVLDSMQLVLALDGHDIVAAEGGAAGIEQFHTSKMECRPFDIVITDLGMAHVDGRQVARAIKQMSPETPVILLTGWGQRMSAAGELPECIDLLLSKPPKLEELRGALASLVRHSRLQTKLGHAA